MTQPINAERIILVTGATGNQGGAIARQLLQRGKFKVRAMVRDQNKLMEDRLNYGTFELCAEGHLNGKEVAALIGEALEKKIEAVKVNPDKPADTSKDPDDKKQTSPMQSMFDWYDHHGLVGNSLILRAILDREPRTLRAYLKELAAKPVELASAALSNR